MIITHLRDAFRAIYSAARLVKGDLIITNQTPAGNGAVWRSLCRRVANGGNLQSWWVFTEACIEQPWFQVMGFKVIRRRCKMKTGTQMHRPGP